MVKARSQFIFKTALTLLVAGLFVALTLPTLSAKAQEKDDPNAPVGTMTVTSKKTATSSGGGEETHAWVKGVDYSSGNEPVTDDSTTEEDVSCEELGKRASSNLDSFNAYLKGLLQADRLVMLTVNDSYRGYEYYVAKLDGDQVKWSKGRETTKTSLDLTAGWLKNATFDVSYMGDRNYLRAAEQLELTRAFHRMQSASETYNDCLEQQVGDLPVEDVK